MPRLLFAYGTLMPSDRDAATREGWLADAVRGRLFDLGPYPALIDLDDPGAGWVEGFVRPTDLDELRSRLDPWEDVDQGLYRRVGTISRAGLPVWVYVYNQPLPPGAVPVVSGQWSVISGSDQQSGRRRVFPDH